MEKFEISEVCRPASLSQADELFLMLVKLHLDISITWHVDLRSHNPLYLGFS